MASKSFTNTPTLHYFASRLADNPQNYEYNQSFLWSVKTLIGPMDPSSFRSRVEVVKIRVQNTIEWKKVLCIFLSYFVHSHKMIWINHLHFVFHFLFLHQLSHKWWIYMWALPGFRFVCTLTPNLSPIWSAVCQQICTDCSIHEIVLSHAWPLIGSLMTSLKQWDVLSKIQSDPRSEPSDSPSQKGSSAHGDSNVIQPNKGQEIMAIQLSVTKC